MTISKLISYHIANITYGQIEGFCTVCGTKTSKGFEIRKVFSNSFTSWSLLEGGDCVCPECAAVFKEGIFRRHSFVVSKDTLFVFKNDQALNVLMNPPEPPFFIHIAKTGQKYTWLPLVNSVSTSKDDYYFSYEKIDVPVRFIRDVAEKYLKYISDAIEHKVTKSELLYQFKPQTWGRAISEGFEENLREIEKFRKDPLWEVLVDVFRY